MTNEELREYRPYPVCDGHMHPTMAHPVDLSAAMFRNIMTFYNYERIILLALINSTKGSDPANNAKALYLKYRLNVNCPGKRVYAFGSITHYYDERDTDAGYLAQAERLHALGFDGVKILDGKPALRKKLGRRLDDPIFDKFYAYLEENDIPVTMHAGDPPSFWDINKISEYALKVGWYCDETFPTLEEIQDEVRGILNKFPRLRLTLAHFFFLSHDYNACLEMFEKYPNVSFDLTPNGLMYKDFQESLFDWRRFFEYYSDRIHFGTDTYNSFFSADLNDYANNTSLGYRINLVRTMLEKTETIEDQNYGSLTTLNLSHQALMNIYHDNFVRRLGEPREILENIAADYTAEILSKMEMNILNSGDEERDALEIENLRKIYAYFVAVDPVSN